MRIVALGLIIGVPALAQASADGAAPSGVKAPRPLPPPASYRLGPVIEEGGELIIYAPHLRCISETHGRLIERYGYAPLETVRELVAQSAELEANLCVAAHLAHVSFAGRRDETGRILPRYRITLASAVDEATCRRVNLGFMDYHQFRRADYESDPDTLVVERAGRDLYLVAPPSP